MRLPGSHMVDDEAPPEVAVIQTALCYLMTRYATRPCAGLIITIVHHLRMLLAHPDTMVLSEEQRKIYREMLQQWQSVAERQQVAHPHRTRTQPVVLH